MVVPSMYPARYSMVLAFMFVITLWNPPAARGQQVDPCTNMAPPPGAQSAGYLRKVICLAPSIADISVSAVVPNKLYSGPWWNAKSFPITMFSSSEQALALSSGAMVTTETRKSLPGMLPLLPASSGFYVEFAERLSDNNADHWPAVWLMPQEHDGSQDDHVAGDPAHYERWMELDVDEGGFNKTGHHGAMISWWGIYPNYSHQNASNDPVSVPPLDRTQEHIFGLSYDPVHSTVAWWLDGVQVGTASTAGVPPIVKTYHYYIIMWNQTHGLNLPYTMYIRYFSAWSGTSVPNPPSGVHTAPAP